MTKRTSRAELAYSGHSLCVSSVGTVSSNSIAHTIEPYLVSRLYYTLFFNSFHSTLQLIQLHFPSNLSFVLELSLSHNMVTLMGCSLCSHVHLSHSLYWSVACFVCLLPQQINNISCMCRLLLCRLFLTPGHTIILARSRSF